MKTSIGIDLGTSYTCAGFMKKGNFQIIELASSRKTLNYVAFKNNGREIGENLKLKIRMNYKNIVFDSKGILFLFLF
jgi:heat shock protein 5